MYLGRVGESILANPQLTQKTVKFSNDDCNAVFFSAWT